jgi:Transposase DDE domain
MPSKYDTDEKNRQESQGLSQELLRQLEKHLDPLLVWLDTMLDKRLVKTVLLSIVAIIEFRNPTQGLLLSELGAYIAEPSKAPAGTKRLSNLLRSKKWSARHVEEYIVKRAEKKIEELEEGGEDVLCIWDGSVIEKPESTVLEGLGPVKSSKAKRRNRTRKGVCNKPAGKPVVVMGMEWTGMLVAGMKGIPEVLKMHWWTRRGNYASKQREEERSLLEWVTGLYGERLLHIFDRGYAGAPWLREMEEYETRFVIRWVGHHLFFDAHGVEKKLWQIALGKRPWGTKEVYDAVKQCPVKAGVFALPVRHAGYAGPLWLVVVRRKGSSWYLITNEPVETEKQAWKIVFAYVRRWQIEMSFRYGKSELAMESPRVWSWENRKENLLRLFCRRTGKRCRTASAPLYRLRWAMSRLWLSYHPTVSFSFLQNSG